MAKILCAYSGIEFTCEHFPVTLHAREAYHPIFNVPQKKLLSFLGKWSAGELTPVDSYLLFLATLNSTELVEFRVPCAPNPLMNSIVAQNMEFLMRTVIKLNTVSNPGVLFSRYAITPETKFLSNVHHWIENWKESYDEFRAGKIKEYDNRALLLRERALERLIKNPHKSNADLAHQIAEWAAVAGEFPTFTLISPLTGKTVSCDVYWKDLLVRAARKEFLGKAYVNDLQELLDHCEDKINAIGSIFSHRLFSILRDAVERQGNWLGLGDNVPKKSGNFTFVEKETSTELANMQALIASAPTEKPERHMYPSNFEFMRAKMRWEMAQRHGGKNAQ